MHASQNRRVKRRRAGTVTNAHACSHAQSTGRAHPAITASRSWSCAICGEHESAISVSAMRCYLFRIPNDATAGAMRLSCDGVEDDGDDGRKPTRQSSSALKLGRRRSRQRTVPGSTFFAGTTNTITKRFITTTTYGTRYAFDKTPFSSLQQEEHEVVQVDS
jgi:hypothetical protein